MDETTPSRAGGDVMNVPIENDSTTPEHEDR
jgi:hypothetical protein